VDLELADGVEQDGGGDEGCVSVEVVLVVFFFSVCDILILGVKTVHKCPAVSNAGLLAEQEVEDVRGLFGRHQTIVEDRGQTSSFGGMQRVFLTPGPMLVHAQSPPEDQSDCPEVTEMNVG
jgi:hypothetical protein